MGKILKKLKNLLAKLLIVIAVIAFVIAVVFTGGLLGIAAIGWFAIGMGALALAFVVDKKTAKETVDKVASGAAQLAGSAGHTIGSLISSTAGALLSSKTMWILLGVGGGLYYFTNKQTDLKQDNEREES